MKAVILSGGLGSRISEETHNKPKPMVEINEKPILWHIMKIYSQAGINEFIICCGYKGYLIKEYFANYSNNASDVTYDMSKNTVTINRNNSENWIVTVVDTGQNTMTAGRIKRIEKYLNNESSFCLTYGDGVCDINIKKLIKFHNDFDRIGTVTVVTPPGRFGEIKLNKKNLVTTFDEKPTKNDILINGGFFVFSHKIFSLIKNDKSVLEIETLKILVKMKQLTAFHHKGFWHPMDTLRDKYYLENLIKSKKAPWITW